MPWVGYLGFETHLTSALCLGLACGLSVSCRVIARNDRFLPMVRQVFKCIIGWCVLFSGEKLGDGWRMRCRCALTETEKSLRSELFRRSCRNRWDSGCCWLCAPLRHITACFLLNLFLETCCPEWPHKSHFVQTLAAVPTTTTAVVAVLNFLLLVCGHQEQPSHLDILWCSSTLRAYALQHSDTHDSALEVRKFLTIKIQI